MQASHEPTPPESAPRPPGDGLEDVPGYRELVRIGQGGFSVVFRAHQETFDRAVALKVLMVGYDEDVRRRFLREVKLTGRLTGHPHVVTVLEAGTTRSGRPYLATELYERGSLKDRLNAEGAVPATEVALIGAKIADALSAAHGLGILHRDVKPNNILVSRFGEPALADFGVACLLDARASSTVLDVFSPHHAAPEMVTRGAPSPASDIYALGSTLYQLLCGRVPFGHNSEEVVAVLWQIVHDSPPQLDCPDLPQLSDLIRRALAKDPADRFPSAAAFADALRALVPASTSLAPALPQAHTHASGDEPATAQVAGSAAADGNTPRYQTPATVPRVGSAEADGAHHSAGPAYATDTSWVNRLQDLGATRSRPDRVVPESQTGGTRRGRRRAVYGTIAVGMACALGLVTTMLWARWSQSSAAEHAATPWLVTAGSATAAVTPHATGTTVGAPVPALTPSPGAEGPAGTAANARGSTGGNTGGNTGGSTGGNTGGAVGPAAPTTPATTTKTTPAISTSCSGWKSQDPHPGTYGYMAGSYHLKVGPYEACNDVTIAVTGTKVWYHCYVINAYGNTWTQVRIAGTNTQGWMSNDNLTRQTGSAYRC